MYRLYYRAFTIYTKITVSYSTPDKISTGTRTIFLFLCHDSIDRAFGNTHASEAASAAMCSGKHSQTGVVDAIPGDTRADEYEPPATQVNNCTFAQEPQVLLMQSQVTPKQLSLCSLSARKAPLRLRLLCLCAGKGFGVLGY